METCEKKYETFLSDNSSRCAIFYRQPIHLSYGDAVLGILLSGSILYIYTRESQQRTSFNLICAIRAANNILVMITGFVLVYIPGALLGFSVFPKWLESFLICVSLNFYLFNEFQSIYISMNRFTAIYFPIWYNFFCGFYATIFVQVLLYGHRCVNVGYETYQRTSEKSKLLKPNSHKDSENNRNIKRNIKLFLQTVLQDVLFFIDNFFTSIMMYFGNTPNEIYFVTFSGLIQHRFWFFICATFVWQTIHVIDGLVMIMFNDRFSLLKRSLFPSQSAPVSMIVESNSWRNQPRRQDIPMVA
ncbi:Protein CBG23237 [Caenorhabditis briggsae]|uniref:Protein CBG23237 n=1 Tax=Caenorhabditis briggsae TaxID=6238 RepID=A8Y4E1_CAEBR|nr:Protein CBG23237 [Caenorhabditis briggsae]CAP39761.2 Protein CBG23237 [Caenorhabditis briggsae]